MNLLLKVFTTAVLCFFISQLCGCASSNLVDIWHDPSYQTPQLSKILVIAIRKDATKRRIWEDAFSIVLSKHGVSATSSYILFPDALPDTNQIAATVQSNNFDGILITTRLPTEINKQYIQGYTTVEQDMHYNHYYDPYYVPYWQRYLTYYREIDHPGYVDSQTVDIRTIDVTTTGKGGRMIWSATSRTPDPVSVTDVQHDIVNLVISDLVKRNIIILKK